MIDSVAGGGGLITVPTLSLLLGPGAVAIGTNKIVGLAGASVALAVYARKGHVEWRRAITFAATVAIGSLVGSRVAFLVPPDAYRWILAAAAPAILWLVWNKDFWVHEEGKTKKTASRSRIVAAALVCGFYDGVAGPGGGTIMFLALFLYAGQGLLPAIASAKLANVASAGVALASFAQAGMVRWERGLPMALGMCFGALIGATVASGQAAKWARIALTTVALLLVFRLIST